MKNQKATTAAERANLRAESLNQCSTKMSVSFPVLPLLQSAIGHPVGVSFAQCQVPAALALLQQADPTGIKVSSKRQNDGN